MSTIYLSARTGLRAWVLRKLELMSVNATLAWAERDREYHSAQLAALPKALRTLDRDIELLRVRQAVLRG